MPAGYSTPTFCCRRVPLDLCLYLKRDNTKELCEIHTFLHIAFWYRWYRADADVGWKSVSIEKKKRDPRWEKKTRWFIDADAIFVRGKKFFFCSLHSRFFSAPNSRRGCSFVCWTLIFFLSVTAPSRLLWNNSIGTTPCVGCSCAPTRSPSAAIFRYLHENTNLHERQKDLKKRWKNPDRWRQVCIKCG